MVKDPETKTRMLAHIEAWQNTNVTQKAYSSEHNIPYHVFHYWYRVYRKVKVVARRTAKPSGTFVKLKVKAAASVAGHTELILPDGKRVVFHQPVPCEYLKALIR